MGNILSNKKLAGYTGNRIPLFYLNIYSLTLDQASLTAQLVFLYICYRIGSLLDF